MRRSSIAWRLAIGLSLLTAILWLGAAAISGYVVYRELGQAFAAAKTALDAASTAMADLGKCRRQPKDFKKDMEMMKGNYDGLAAQVGGIESAIASEDYLGAKAQGDSLKSSVDMLVSDLQGAKVKIKC